jgi:hypothetical protein
VDWKAIDLQTSIKDHPIPFAPSGIGQPISRVSLIEVDTMASNSLQTPMQPDDNGSVSKSARKTIRVGHDTVEIDVEAVKQFIETVKDKSAVAEG